MRLETWTTTKHYKVHIENGKNNKNNKFIYADKKQLQLHFIISKNPCFKDPMRFGIWTFLDILKMSIFGFLEEMFFCRTENPEL